MTQRNIGNVTGRCRGLQVTASSMRTGGNRLDLPNSPSQEACFDFARTFPMNQQPPQKEPDDPLTDSGEDLVLPESDEMLHRLGTPLTIINGYVQLLRRRNRARAGQDADVMETSLAAIEGAVNRMKSIVDEHRRALDGANDDESAERQNEENRMP